MSIFCNCVKSCEVIQKFVPLPPMWIYKKKCFRLQSKWKKCFENIRVIANAWFDTVEKKSVLPIAKKMQNKMCINKINKIDTKIKAISYFGTPDFVFSESTSSPTKYVAISSLKIEVENK